MLTHRAKYSPETQSVVDHGRDARLVPTAHCGRPTKFFDSDRLTRHVNTGRRARLRFTNSILNQTNFFLRVKLVKLLDEKKGDYEIISTD